MIRINLLPQQAPKKLLKSKFSLTSKQLVIIGFTTIGLVICVIVLLLIRNFILSPVEKKSQMTITEDYVPSTFPKTDIVEEVVQDVDNSTVTLNRKGLLDLPYEQLSFVEKINYEIHFAYNICNLLTRTVLPGVDFKELHIRSFKTMQGIGLSNSKKSVIKVFQAMKNEKVEILPKPKTKISRKEDDFYFIITCITEFGLDLEAPFLLGPDDVLSYDDLNLTIKKFTEIAEDDGFKITSNLKRYKANVIGDFKRIRYRFSGITSYTKFVSFINNLYQRRVQCAFENFDLVAIDKNSLKINADILFTTSN